MLEQVFKGLLRGERPVAVKVLDISMASHGQLHMFLKEVAVLASCSHPHIVQVNDALSIVQPCSFVRSTAIWQ